MEIKIGETPPVVKENTTDGRSVGGSVEATLLSMRPPRKRGGRRSMEQDELKAGENPENGRVMVLLVPEGYKIPRDIESRQYRIFLRFAPLTA